MEVQLAVAKVHQYTSSNSGDKNKIEIRLIKNFEEITYHRRGDEFNAYHRCPS